MSGAPALVVGAGISGLAAAFELTRRGVDVLLVDPADGPGGVLRTHRADGYLFEDGPNTVQGSAEPFLAFARDLGLADELVPCLPAAKRRALVVGGKWRALPASPPGLLFSPLFSLAEKWRLLREPKAPARVPPPDAAPGDEETVFAFFARRFGRGPVERYLDAVISGVNGGDPRRLGVESSFPELVALEREHGSLFRGLGAKRKARPAGEPRPPAVVSFRAGLGALAAAAIARIGPPRFRPRTRAAALRRAADGGFEATLVGPSGAATVRVARVVLAAPAAETAALLAPFSPAASGAFAAVECASMVVVQTGFAAADVPGLAPGFGALAPRREGLRMLGWLTPSFVFPGRAPEGEIAVSGFRGGAFEPDVARHDDAALLATSCAELARVLGLRAPPRPRFSRVVRWPHALPLANVGHAYRLREAAAALRAVAPGIVVVGNAAAGAAVPKCVAFARAAVAGD